MSDYEIKKRDNRPVWQLTLKKGPTGRGKPFDLRDATVRLYIEHENGNGLVVEGEEVDVKRGMLGEVEYEFDQEQTLYGGNHPAEFEIEWDDGGTATVPNRGYYNVRINTPLNRGLSAAELEPGDYTVGYLHANAVDTRELTVGNDGPYTSLAGPGLTRENGRLAVTAEFSGIEGMSNPATAHVDFDNYDAQNVGELDSQSVRTEQLNNIPWMRNLVTGGSGTRNDSYLVDEAVTDGYNGKIEFGKGWFETSGLVTDDSFDWSDSATTFAGDGIRTTTLYHEDGTSPTIDIQSGGGNFGGVTDMTVYGADAAIDEPSPDSSNSDIGTAPIVRSDGPIDSQFRNVIIRYGGGDCLVIEGSASGTRVQNTWLENVEGWGLRLEGGNRPRVINTHAVGNAAGQLYTAADDTHFVACSTSAGTSSGPGIELDSDSNNIVSYVSGTLGSSAILINEGTSDNHILGAISDSAQTLIENRGEATKIAFAGVTNTTRQAINQLQGTLHAAHITIHDWCRSSGAYEAIRLNSDGNSLHNINVHKSDTQSGEDVLIINGSNNYINGLHLGESIEDTDLIDIQSGSDNVIENLTGFNWTQIADSGTRTLINGYGTNSGDPRTEGEWNGSASYAGKIGATVWDTTTSPWTAYEATPEGTWAKRMGGEFDPTPEFVEQTSATGNPASVPVTLDRNVEYQIEATVNVSNSPGYGNTLLRFNGNDGSVYSTELVDGSTSTGTEVDHLGRIDGSTTLKVKFEVMRGHDAQVRVTSANQSSSDTATRVQNFHYDDSGSIDSFDFFRDDGAEMDVEMTVYEQQW